MPDGAAVAGRAGLFLLCNFVVLHHIEEPGVTLLGRFAGAENKNLNARRRQFCLLVSHPALGPRRHQGWLLYQYGCNRERPSLARIAHPANWVGNAMRSTVP